MENVKHNFRNNAIVINENSLFLGKCHVFTLSICCYFLRGAHNLCIVLTIQFKRPRFSANESHNLIWAILGIGTDVCLHLLSRMHINFHETTHTAYSQLSLYFFFSSNWPSMVSAWRLNSDGLKAVSLLTEQSTFWWF